MEKGTKRYKSCVWKEAVFLGASVDVGGPASEREAILVANYSDHDSDMPEHMDVIK